MSKAALICFTPLSGSPCAAKVKVQSTRAIELLNKKRGANDIAPLSFNLGIISLVLLRL